MMKFEDIPIVMEASSPLQPPETSTVTTKWEYNAALALVNSIGSHFDDLKDPSKRKHVWEHVSNDLLSNGFSYSEDQCSVKWKGLVRSYRNCMDKKRLTGKGPSRFHFFDVIDNIMSKPQSLHILDTSQLGENTKLEQYEIFVETTTEEPDNRKRSIELDDTLVQKKKKQKRTELTRWQEEILDLERRRLSVEEEKVRLLRRILDRLD